MFITCVYVLSNSQRVADKKEGVGTYCPYHTREASRIALVASKDNSPHLRICKKPLRAVHTKDVVPLPNYLRDLEILREFHE